MDSSLLALSTYILPFFCIILAINSTIKLLEYKECMFMRKRSIFIAFGLNISLIMAIIAVVTLDVVIMYHTNQILFILSTIFFFTSWWSVLFYLNTKNWIIHYKYFWQYYSLQLQWQQIINPKVTETIRKNNWYIHNNHRYGNLPFILKTFTFIHTIDCLLCIIAMYLGLFNHSQIRIIITISLYSISLIPAVIFYVVIVCKTPSFNDTFHLHWEVKQHRNILLIAMITFAVVIFISILLEEPKQITSIIAVSGLSITYYSMCYVSTTGIIKKNKDMSKHDNSRKLSLARSISSLSNQNSSNRKEKLQKRIILDDVFMNKKTLNLFMSHLSKEYSTECLLSYIEINQFQRYLLSFMPEFERIDHTVLGIKIFETPSNVPKSGIIETDTPCVGGNDTLKMNDQEDTDCSKKLKSAKRRAHKLYNKYIKAGGTFEINIGGPLRDDMAKILSDLDALMANNMSFRDLLLLFQEPKDEMTNLLNFSFARWKLTEEFDEIVNLLADSWSSKIRAFSRTNSPRSSVTQSNCPKLDIIQQSEPLPPANAIKLDLGSISQQLSSMVSRKNEETMIGSSGVGSEDLSPTSPGSTDEEEVEVAVDFVYVDPEY